MDVIGNWKHPIKTLFFEFCCKRSEKAAWNGRLKRDWFFYLYANKCRFKNDI